MFYMEGKTRGVIFIKSIVCKAVSMAKIDFDHTKEIDTEAPYPLFVYVCVCVCVFFFFFFACQKFRKVGPPLTKIPGSAPVRDFSLATKI